MKKKSLAIMLLAALLISFCACGGTSASAASSSAEAPEEASSAENASSSPAAAPSEEPAETAGSEETAGAASLAEEAAGNGYYTEHVGVEDYALPMFDNDLELSIFWIQLAGMGGGQQPLKEELEFWQRVQSELGMTLTFQQASEAVGNEQYNLMVASGDMTDLIWESNCGAQGTSTAYNGGYDKAIEDDIYVDLTELIPEYAPNYYALITSDANLLRDVSTDTGKLYSIASIYDDPQGAREGALVRKDYLEATGLNTPVTTEDWMEVLKAMKSNGVTYPAGVSSSGDIRGGLFCSAFGTSGGHAFKVDLASDTLVYDGTSDELRDFIEYFRELWENDLVSPDYVNQQMFDTTLITSGDNGLWGGMQTDLTTFKQDYDMDLMAVAATYPSDADGVKQYSYEYAEQRTATMKNVVITTACEDPERALQFLDWFYSTDGVSAVNFGFDEGVSYEVVDGVKQILPFMLDRNEDMVNYEIIYSLDEGPGLYYNNKKAPVQEDYLVEAKEVWLSTDISTALYSSTPTLAFTAEEAEDMAQINSDISTYVSTEVAKFMTCQTELTDETWEAYVQEIEDMGLETLQEIYDAAYERYKSR